MTDPNKPDFWNKLYESSHFPWDLGRPTAVFERLLKEGKLEMGKLLVLGAGRGHDARLFARYGFSVTAVDFSAEAVEAMRQLDDPRYPVEIVQADFFTIPQSWNGRFDTILDYTSFCAVDPRRRAEYADMVARLLRDNGQYIILAFPIGTRPGGPPFVVQPEGIIDLFGRRSLTLVYREFPADSVAGRKGYEELLIFETNRS